MRRLRKQTARQSETAKEGTTRAALAELVDDFRPAHLGPATARLDAAVALDDGTGAVSTVRIRRGRLWIRPGRSRDAETTIVSDPLTLIGVVKGKRSGIEAFLRGRLRVRGNLALALKLDGLFEPDAAGRRPRPRRAVAAGIDTFYLDAGEGPPVILLHGLGGTNASMLTTLWDLSQDHRVIAPDLPGFGDSSKPLRAYHAAFFARWLVAFMNAIGVERAHLVGNSMGGRIALETALRFPSRVDRLALFAPSMAFRRFRQLVPIVRTLAPEMAALPMRAARAQVHHTLRLIFSRPERIRRGWYDAAVDEFQRVFQSPRGRIAFFSAAREIYLEKPFGKTGFWTRLRGLSHPVLFLWGDSDWLVPARFAKHAVAAVPHARSKVVEDCGHVPQFERPNETHSAVRGFFAERARVVPPEQSGVSNEAPELTTAELS